MQEQEVETSDFELIVSSAGQTVYWLIVGLALFATLFVMCFPANAANLYLDMGNKPRAYDCAVRYHNLLKNKSSDKKIDNLLFCINTGANLMTDSRNKHGDSYSKDMVVFTDEYFALDNRKELSKTIDEFNISSSAKELHPNLYSYDAYLSGINYRARIIGGDYSISFIDGEYVDMGQALENLLSGDFVANLPRASVIFANLSVYIDYRHKVFKNTSVLDYSFLTNQDKKVYNTTQNVLDDYIACAVEFNKNNNNSLQSLYYIKSIERLISSLKYLVSDNNWDSSPIDKLEKVEDTTLTKYYYDVLLRQYCNKKKN